MGTGGVGVLRGGRAGSGRASPASTAAARVVTVPKRWSPGSSRVWAGSSPPSSSMPIQAWDPAPKLWPQGATPSGSGRWGLNPAASSPKHAFVAVGGHQVEGHRRPGRDLGAGAEPDGGQGPPEGDRAGRVQPERLVGAALQEEPVGAGPDGVLGVVVAPAEHLVHGVGEGVGGRVGAGLEVEGDLPPHHFGRQVEVVLVAQQHGQHVGWQLRLGEVAGTVAVEEAAAALDRGPEEPRRRSARGLR